MEFIPTPQANSGLAEETARLASQRGGIWGNLAANLGQQAAEAMKARQNQPPNLEQLRASGMMPAAPQMQAGQVGPPNDPVARAFGSGPIPQQLLPLLQHLAAARETTARQDTKINNEYPPLTQQEWDKMTPERQKAMTESGLGVGHPYSQKAREAAAKPAASGGDSLDGIAQDIADGKVAPAQISEILGRGGAGDRKQLWAKVKKLKPEFDAQSADKFFFGEKSGAQAGARFQESGDPQKIGRAIKSLDPILDDLQKASTAYSRSNVRALNTIIGAFNKQYGTQAQSFEQFSADSKTLMASIMAQGGVPHEEMIKMMSENFPPNATDKQVVKGISNIRSIMKARGKGLMTRVSAKDFESPPASSDTGEKHGALLDKYGEP